MLWLPKPRAASKLVLTIRLSFIPLITPDPPFLRSRVIDPDPPPERVPDGGRSSIPEFSLNGFDGGVSENP